MYSRTPVRPIASWLALAALLTIFPAAAIFAQQVDCTKALVIERDIYQSDEAMRLALIHTIDRTAFNEMKRGVRSGGEIPIEGVPVKGHFDYDEFEQARQREFEHFEYNESLDRSLSYIRERLSPAGAQAFIECIRTYSFARPGVHLWVQNITHDAVEVAILWIAPPGADKKGEIVASVLGSKTNKDLVLPRELLPSSESRALFERLPNTDFRLVANVNGFADSVMVVRRPKIKEVKQDLITVLATQFINPQDVALSAITSYGADVLLNAPDYHGRPNAAEWVFTVDRAGRFRFQTEYAAASARPVVIAINGIVVRSGAMATATGCWETNCQKWIEEGEVTLPAGQITMRVSRSDVFPHIRAFRFTPVP